MVHSCDHITERSAEKVIRKKISLITLPCTHERTNTITRRLPYEKRLSNNVNHMKSVRNTDASHSKYANNCKLTSHCHAGSHSDESKQTGNGRRLKDTTTSSFCLTSLFFSMLLQVGLNLKRKHLQKLSQAGRSTY